MTTPTPTPTPTPHPTAPTPDAEQWHRLHPATLPLRILSDAKKLLLPGLVVLWFARGGKWELWLMLLFVPSAVIEVVRYLALRYRFTADELIVRHQLVFTRERHIPYRRIHNIDLVQGPLQRAFGVADVQVQTASGSKPEAEFRMLATDAAAKLRQRTGAGETAQPDSAIDDPPDVPADDVLVHLDPRELVRLGLIVNQGAALVAVALGALWQLDVFEDIDWPEHWPTLAGAADVPWSLLIAGGLAIAVVVTLLLAALSIAWTIGRFHDFRLVRDDDDLRITCGLFTRRTSTIPRQRIQFLTLHRSPLHRLFGRTSIRVETAGGSGAEDPGHDHATTFGRRWFVPLWPTDRIGELLDALDHPPARGLDDVEWTPLGRRALARIRRKSVVVSLVPSAIVGVAAFPWGLAATPLLVGAALWHAHAEWRRLGYAITPDTVFFRSGALTHRTSAVGLDAMQVVGLTQNPFDRRHHMSTLRIDTAGAGPAGHRVSIPYLAEDVAFGLEAELFVRSARTPFRW